MSDPETHSQTKVGANRNCLERFYSDGKDFVYCTLCAKYPETVRLHVRNRKLPRIATKDGTLFRPDIVRNHLISEFHIACENVERIKVLTKPDQILTPMNVAIDKANSLQKSYVGKLIIQIFIDAKTLALPAWNWPARYVTNEASNAFKYDNHEQNNIPGKLSLQYVNPIKHLELMKCIVEADKSNMKSQILDCCALSLRVDGSVDRTHEDKIYVAARELQNCCSWEWTNRWREEQSDFSTQ